MNNSTITTSSSSCTNTEALQPIIDMNRFITYHIIAPIYIIVCFCCHAFFLFAIYLQSKKQPAYLYQVFQSVAETSMVLIRSVNILTRFASSQTAYSPTYQNPFKSLSYSYEFMWYSGRMSAYLSNSVITTSLLLSASMAADRVFALFKPNKYRWINHKRHQMAAVVISVALSFSASAFDCFRNTVIETPTGAYAIMLNYQYIGTTRFLVFAVCICTLQVIGLVSLVLLSIILCFLYRKQYIKPKVVGVNAVETEEQRLAKKGEKTLALLTLLECIFKAISTSFPVLMYLTQYASPSLFSCINNLMTGLLDLTMMLADLGSFFAVIGVSKAVRKILRQALPCGLLGITTVTVTPFASNK